MADMDIDQPVDMNLPRTRNARSGAAAPSADREPSHEQEIRRNQKELARRNQEEGMSRFKLGGSKSSDGKESKRAADDKVECYRSPADYPQQAKNTKVWNASVLCNLPVRASDS